jgi:hypothetical protein
VSGGFAGVVPKSERREALASQSGRRGEGSSCGELQ